jgi:hypothetical protein
LSGRERSPSPPTRDTESSAAWDRLLHAAGSLSRGGTDAFTELSEAEWADFLAECDLHWVTPLIYRTLAAHRGRVPVPQAVWRGFKKMYLLSRARTRRADGLIIPVLSALSAAWIPVIVLKGMHLSTQAYDDPASRPMIDADLLVRREHLSAAARIVESFGFRQEEAETPSGPQRGRASDDHHQLAIFWYPKGPPIELHYDLEAPDLLPCIDLEGVWRRASPARIGGAEVLVLSPEDTILQLCIHMAFHHLFAVKLLNLCDIPVVLDRWRDRIDWNAFWARARAWGVERSVLITFALTQDRLGYKLDNCASAALAPHLPEMGTLMDMAERQMRNKAAALARRRLSPKPAPRNEKPGFHAFLKLRQHPSLPGRARLVVNRVFLPRRELSASFGLASDPLWLPLLYPVRLAVLIARHVPGVMRFAVLRRIRRKDEPEIREILETEMAQRSLASWLRKGLNKG